MKKSSNIKRIIVIGTFIVTTLCLCSLSYSKWYTWNKDAVDEEYATIQSLNDTLVSLSKELSKMHSTLLKENSIILPNLSEFASIPHTTTAVLTTTSDNTTPKPDNAKIDSGVHKSAVLFTMDSISTYETNSRSGGAAGELIIRHALERAFSELGSSLRVLRSDEEFNRCNLGLYDIVILDSWTWAAKGWVPKRNIVGHEHKVYVLDFFGAKTLRNDGLKIPPSRILTAYGSQWNTFLGYYMDPTVVPPGPKGDGAYGVIWGKDAKHFAGREKMLQAVADDTKMVATATARAFSHPNVEWRGHQGSAEWRTLLQRSKFLLGLGNPLLGPSALDAIASGAMYINPVYNTPAYDGTYTSQHPFAVQKIGDPHVCSYREDSLAELRACVRLALNTTLEPLIPVELTEDAYLGRVRAIFGI